MVTPQLTQARTPRRVVYLCARRQASSYCPVCQWQLYPSPSPSLAHRWATSFFLKLPTSFCSGWIAEQGFARHRTEARQRRFNRRFKRRCRGTHRAQQTFAALKLCVVDCSCKQSISGRGPEGKGNCSSLLKGKGNCSNCAFKLSRVQLATRTEPCSAPGSCHPGPIQKSRVNHDLDQIIQIS